VASSSPPSSSAASSGSPTVSASPNKTIRLGFSPLSLDIPALQATANALKDAGAATGMSVTVADPKEDVQTQVAQIQQWIQLHQVDAIWVIPVAPPAIIPLIKQAQQAKIPILVDTQPSKVNSNGPQPGVSFASIDYQSYGKDLGGLLVDCINTRLGGKAQIIYLNDPGAQSSNADTDKAVATAVAGVSGARIVRTVSPDSQIVAQQDTLSALQAVPQANAALGTNDEAVLGAASAFQQAGKDPKKSCIIGGGGGDQAIAAIKSGTVYAGATFDFETDTRNNIGAIMAMVGDPTAVGKEMRVPIKIVRPS
jgi:ABC-type sugar transport system substrate-binding protein